MPKMLTYYLVCKICVPNLLVCGINNSCLNGPTSLSPLIWSQTYLAFWVSEWIIIWFLHSFVLSALSYWVYNNQCKYSSEKTNKKYLFLCHNLQGVFIRWELCYCVYHSSLSAGSVCGKLGQTDTRTSLLFIQSVPENCLRSDVLTITFKPFICWKRFTPLFFST